MPISRAQRILMAVAALVCAAAALTAVYLYRSRYSPPVSGPLPSLVTQLSAGAPAVAYIDVVALRGLKNSPLASLLGLATSGPDEDREYQEFVLNTGFDYSRDLDRAALAYWPTKEQPKAKSQSGAKSQNNDILAIADGRFDQAKIKAYALRSGTIVTRGTHSMYQVPGDPPVIFEFLSSTRVSLASGPNAEAHLLATDSPGLDPVVQTLVNHVGGAPFFAVARADALPETVYASIGQSSQVGGLAKSILGLTLAGRPDAGNLELALDARCDSMASALQISALLGGFRVFGSLAISDPKTKSQMTKEQAALLAALLAQVQIRQQENWVRITLEVTPQMLAAAAQH
jgi:hypothetical protein